jgi:pimeloyl-ACP methyl ester carboxylesterase
MPITTDNVLLLPDGRRLGYASYGADDGWPVLFFHGIPGSRHSAHSAGLVGDSHGARVIAFDRPGYGLSDPQPGREIHDWPHDVADALDVLGIDRFSLFGYSGGGPFALATAAAMPDRVASLTNVSAMGPLDTTEAAAMLTRRQKLERFVVAHLSPLVRWQTAGLARQVHRDVATFLHNRMTVSPAADRVLLEDAAINAVMRQDLRSSMRQGGGTLAHELRLMARPWGFNIEDVRAPMQLWHGSADDIVPLWLAESVAARLPHAKRRFVSDAAHLLMLSHMTAIIEQLLASRFESPLPAPAPAPAQAGGEEALAAVGG